jgi:hypothetical protein
MFTNFHNRHFHPEGQVNTYGYLDRCLLKHTMDIEIAAYLVYPVGAVGHLRRDVKLPAF